MLLTTSSRGGGLHVLVNLEYNFFLWNSKYSVFCFLFVIGSEYNVNISPKKNWNIIQYDKNQHVSRHIKLKVSSSFFLFPKYLKYFLKLSCDLCQILFLFLFLFFGRTSNTCQFFFIKKNKNKKATNKCLRGKHEILKSL